jgi:ABC-2 type transport system ATP-binding protein
MCDNIAIIKQGQIVKYTSVKDILISEWVEWQLSDPARAIKILKEKWGITATASSDNIISALLTGQRLEEINSNFINEKVELKYSYAKQNTLEEIFLDLTEGDEIV